MWLVVLVTIFVLLWVPMYIVLLLLDMATVINLIIAGLLAWVLVAIIALIRIAK